MIVRTWTQLGLHQTTSGECQVEYSKIVFCHRKHFSLLIFACDDVFCKFAEWSHISVLDSTLRISQYCFCLDSRDSRSAHCQTCGLAAAAIVVVSVTDQVSDYKISLT